MAKRYSLKLKAGFPAPSRTRSGITVPAGSGIEVELTDEQLQAFKADPEVVVQEIATKSAPTKNAVDNQKNVKQA